MRIKNYSFNKSTCEKYEIYFNRGEWVFITIDESLGLFQVHSSYGNYNYSWPNHGRKSFKHFILELAQDSYYFLGKVAKENYFYEEKTEEEWKQQIIDDRRGKGERDLTQEQARELWNIIEDIDYDSPEYCQNEICSNSLVQELYCEPWYYFRPVVGYSPDALFFAKEIMPMFAEIIKKELNIK